VEEEEQHKAILQQKEDALLLERVLLRERRIKLEEVASRTRRIESLRLHVRNSDDEGFMCSVGAAYHTDHTVRVLGARIPASASIRDDIALPSSTPVPTSDKPKAEVSASSILAMM